MNPWKRLGAVLLTSSLLLAFASACGDDDGDDNADNTTTEATDGNGTQGTGSDGTASDGTGAGTDNETADALRQKMIDDGLSEEQPDCTITALGATLSEDQMAELVDMEAGDDLNEDQTNLLEESFRAAAGCGYDVFDQGGTTTTG